MLGDHGHEVAVLKQARQARDTATVERLTKKLLPPDLEMGEQLFVNAFITLESERYYDGGPIPWSKVTAYCAEYKLNGRQCEDMHYFITLMDNAIRSERAKKQKNKDGKAEDGNPTRHSRSDGHRANRGKAPRKRT